MRPLLDNADANTFRWRLGLLHALGPCVLIMLAGSIYVGIRAPTDPSRLLRLIALLAVVETPFALLGSYLSQTGRREAGRLVGAVGLLALGAVILGNDARLRAITLTSEERAPLTRVKEGEVGRLRHRTLGFSLLDPGLGFTEDGSQEFNASAQFHAYADRSTGESLIVGLFKGQGESEASLRALLAGVKKEAAPLAGHDGNTPVDVVRFAVSGGERPQGELSVVVWRAKPLSPTRVRLASCHGRILIRGLHRRLVIRSERPRRRPDELPPLRPG